MLRCFLLMVRKQFLIEFQLHQRKMSIKRLFSLFYFVLMNIVVFSHSTYSKPFEQRWTKSLSIAEFLTKVSFSFKFDITKVWLFSAFLAVSKIGISHFQYFSMCFPPPGNIVFAFIRLFYRRRPILFAYAENGRSNNEALMMLQQGGHCSPQVVNDDGATCRYVDGNFCRTAA